MESGVTLGCLLLCKDKNFKANHNAYAYERMLLTDVCYYAKIRILKQITTCHLLTNTLILMFVTMQR